LSELRRDRVCREHQHGYESNATGEAEKFWGHGWIAFNDYDCARKAIGVRSYCALTAFPTKARYFWAMC